MKTDRIQKHLKPYVTKFQHDKRHNHANEIVNANAMARGGQAYVAIET